LTNLDFRELSEGAEMPFMNLNSKSQVEGTKHSVYSFIRRMLITYMMSAMVLTRSPAAATYSNNSTPEGRKLNNLVTLLLDVVPAPTIESFALIRPSDGWIFISFTMHGEGNIRLTLDKASTGEILINPAPGSGPTYEAMHHVTKGRHTLQVERTGTISLEHLTIKAIPELMHCGLGFNPQIKSYGLYDMDFLKRDILPNVTTLIIPNGIKLSNSIIEDWHRQGKRFVAEVGINSQARTAEEHATFWTSFFRKAPFIDGIIINEFIVNRPVSEWVRVMTPDRLARMDKERAAYECYSEAFKKIHADDRFADKSIYAYVGGSGKKLNQEIIGTNVIRSIINCGYFVAPERYLHEMSSEQGSRDALRTFLDGLADWEAKEPGVKKQMVITFGLLSMPPGSINKQPNVDYHVWMDQQMNLVANNPTLVNIAGLNWWTSVLADEETVRFVGKLYRHYAIEGRTDMLTSDPLFLKHIENADFEHGTDGWILRPAEPGSIAPKSFPRYGRIEGRYMGLGRPPDPEHIGDTFLWMKRSEKGPNTFSQTIKDLQPGRLYSFEMLVCDYNDLVTPKPKKVEETKSISTVLIEGADVDTSRSFTEVYASSPEPKIPVCITYHWKIFCAKTTTATLIVIDWQDPNQPTGPFGQEQAFNFLEIQPYHE
jgi:hypothetical protein